VTDILQLVNQPGQKKIEIVKGKGIVIDFQLTKGREELPKIVYNISNGFAKGG
jgi:hypothetical protein